MASVTVTAEQRTYFNEYIKDGAALHQIAIKHGASLDAVLRAVRLGGLEPSKAEIGTARSEIIKADSQALARERRAAAKAAAAGAAKPAPAPKPTPPKPTPPSAAPKPEPAVVDPEQIVLETYKLFENINKAAKAAGVSWPTANKIIEAAGLKKPKPVDPPPADSFPVDNEPQPAEDQTPELPPTATVSIPVEEVLDQIFGALPKTNSLQEETQDMPIPATNSPAPAAQAAPTYKAVLLPENAVPSLQSGLHLIGELDHLLASLVGKVSHARLDVLLTALHSLADAHHTTANPAHAEAASDV